MTVLFEGTLNIAGEPDTGKTMFAFSCGAQPEDTAFIDDDIKGVYTVSEIRSQGKELGFYRNLYDESKGLLELEFHERCLAIIDEMQAEVKKRGKKFDAVIWDTFARFESTFHPYVTTYPGRFRKFWSMKGDIKGAEIWKESFRYEADILNRLQNVGKLIILTSHLKPETIPGGRKTGKFIPDCKQPLVQKTLFRVYLRHNPDGPEPIGLVLKRISRQTVTDEGIKILSVLPRRIKPFTWDKIREYWTNPVGNRPLTEDEKPNEYELSILDGTLTDDQKEILRYQDVQLPEEDLPITEDFPQDVIDKVLELKAENKPNPVIAHKLGLSVREVATILNGV